jgi:uncharacterized membrane protein
MEEKKEYFNLMESFEDGTEESNALKVYALGGIVVLFVVLLGMLLHVPWWGIAITATVFATSTICIPWIINSNSY